MARHHPFTFHARLDRQALQRYYGGNLTYARDMFGAFIHHGPRERARMGRFLNQGDWEALGQALHRLEPALAMVGLSNLARRAAALRQRLRDRGHLQPEDPDLLALLADLDHQLPLLRGELGRLQQALAP